MIAYLSIFLRLAKSSMRLRHSCHCLCESDFHGIRLCLSYGTSSVCDSALCLPHNHLPLQGWLRFCKIFSINRYYKIGAR